MRPAVELLLLAELVGLVVLERHQLFEPVHEKVEDTRAQVTALRGELRQLSQRLDTSGELSFFANPSQTIRAITRAYRDALTREQDSPQILRWARLASVPRYSSDREQGAELLEMVKAHTAFGLRAGDQSETRTRMWSMRNILAVTSLETFDF
jgi:hypothetical protein